ncbi:hypothetical protein ACJRO7_032344 [Eucalyptus globulus]|uniref:Fungal lipase-type domain-containing protein n=1 Tax=Eucalyptus globulus TaxID=34317 RepID=A0ABD3JHL9_EUCGL
MVVLIMLHCNSCSCNQVRSKAHTTIYNHTLATMVVEYAFAISGFEVIEVIVDVQHCLQDLNAAVIAFKGTREHRYAYLYWKRLDINYLAYSSWIYYAYHNATIRPGTLDAVKRAKDLYGDINIMVIGHSMGGTVASFCRFDLVIVQVLTFAQPRIGNAMFFSDYSTPNTIHINNGHEIVLHLPSYYSWFPRKIYHHFPRVAWLYNIGFVCLVYQVEKVCDGFGDGPTCSRLVTGNSLIDHLVYYGVKLLAETWG